MPGTKMEGARGLLTHGKSKGDDTKTSEQPKQPETLEQRNVHAVLFALFDMKTRPHTFDFEKVGEVQYDKSQGEFDANETITLPHGEGFIVTIRTMKSKQLYFTNSLDDVQSLRPLKSEITLEQVREKFNQ